MKNEKMKLSKLESIQMSNFLMKKELISYLVDKNKNQIKKKKFSIFITSFIEDLFNIINQQILTCVQIHELNSESQIDHLINNNKNISFTMILNFYDKIMSYLNSIKNTITISRNFSNNNVIYKKLTNITYINNNKNIVEFEKNFFKKKLKANYNSLKNILIKNDKTYINNNNNKSNILLLSSPNTSKTESLNSMKLDIIDLKKLEMNKEKDDIQVVIKPKEMKENNNIQNINNKIILTKQIYKVCNSIPVSRKNLLNNFPERKNSFNNKIKNNKINIKKSKSNLKNPNVSHSEGSKN